jgi:hypothetical protein
MDRNQAKELLPIITAYSEGKEIQIQHIDGTWQDAKYLNLGRGLIYRIKPEPTYRPFANAEECWHEIRKHEPFIKYKTIESSKDVYLIIQRIKTDGIETDVERLDFETAFECFTFADGTPFGILEEE